MPYPALFAHAQVFPGAGTAIRGDKLRAIVFPKPDAASEPAIMEEQVQQDVLPGVEQAPAS